MDGFSLESIGGLHGVGGVLMIIGGILALIGGLWFLVAAFKESVLWGLAVFFLPFVGLIFLILHWDKAAKPFLVELLGAGLFIAGMVMLASTQAAPI